MIIKIFFGLLLIVHVSLLESKETRGIREDVRKFPNGFQFGAASASYQVEGAWDEDGKSESIWDHETHLVPSTILDGSTGDIAADSYHLYKRDVEIMRELGLDFYRFSMSWTRILPTSFSNQINQAGVDYYNNLINEMLKYNIQPIVTLFHWDLPQKLQEMGGFANPNIVDWFGDYARVAFELFGDRVKSWITINEPEQICFMGYGSDILAPRLNISGVANYICAKNLLLAHAKAYHIYDQEFRSSQGGSIFITLSADWNEPESKEHEVAAEDAFQFSMGHYGYPLFTKTGDWPTTMKMRIRNKSSEQGFPRSRLPEFTSEEIEFIRGTSDYFGLNHYSSHFVYRNESVNYESPSLEDDMGINSYQLNEGNITGSVKYAPWGFYKLLMRIKEEYDNPPVMIIENGVTTKAGLEDDDRVFYLRGYLEAMLDAIDDGCDVRGYTTWSMMDNFSWPFGYTEKFGLYEVDFDSPERNRTPRKSAFVYKEILRTRTLDFNYEPDTTTMLIDEGH